MKIIVSLLAVSICLGIHHLTPILSPLSQRTGFPVSSLSPPCCLINLSETPQSSCHCPARNLQGHPLSANSSSLHSSPLFQGPLELTHPSWTASSPTHRNLSLFTNKWCSFLSQSPTLPFFIVLTLWIPPP